MNPLYKTSHMGSEWGMIKSIWIVHCIGAGLKLLKPDKEWAGVGLSGMGIKSLSEK